MVGNEPAVTARRSVQARAGQERGVDVMGERRQVDGVPVRVQRNRPFGAERADTHELHEVIRSVWEVGAMQNG